jgi:predicted O-methyltransferase YrrM
MRFIEGAVSRLAPAGKLRVLHVGNYVGVSLAFVTDLAARRDPRSTVLSVDPNMPHLGVDSPQDHVLAVLSHFGLQEISLVVSGYTLEKSTGADGDGTGASCERVLESLARMGLRFELALIDGNHDATYLRNEIEVLLPLMTPGGLLVLDDVSRHHPAVRLVHAELAEDRSVPLEAVSDDGRVAILRRTAD